MLQCFSSLSAEVSLWEPWHQRGHLETRPLIVAHVHWTLMMSIYYCKVRLNLWLSIIKIALVLVLIFFGLTLWVCFSLFQFNWILNDIIDSYHTSVHPFRLNFTFVFSLKNKLKSFMIMQSSSWLSHIIIIMEMWMAIK